MPTLAQTSREKSLKCIERLPMLSPMITQLVVRMARPNCDIADLANFIEKDTLLSAQVLRLANSALFARDSYVSSIRQAILLVGIGAVRRFAIGTFISNLFRRTRPLSCFSMSRFNLHSVATGTLAEMLADELPVDHAEDAFVAGLLHDIGKMVIAVCMPEQYESILSAAALDEGRLEEFERAALGVDHSELSGLAIKQWRLGEPIRIAVQNHHTPDAPAAAQQNRPSKVPLSLLIHKADAFVNYRGLSVVPMSQPDPAELPSMDFPGFSYSLERVLARLNPELENLEEFFQQKREPNSAGSAYLTPKAV